MSRELSPQWLEIADGELTIQTPRARLTIELERARVRLLEDGEIAHLRKLASTAGLVAGVGGFDSHLLGEFDLYASNLDKAVLIESSEDRIVVTPDQPAAFLVASAKAGAKV
jgi:hypothetical protein